MKHIDIDLELRRALGVTIHKNMTSSEMLAQWNKVPIEIRNEYPDINKAFETMADITQVYQTSLSIASTFSKAYTAQKEILETGSAVLYAPTLPVAKASDVAQAAVLQAEYSAFNALKELLMQKLVDTLTP